MPSFSFIRPLKLGSLILPSNILYSPLAGCSDLPFRRIASHFRPGIVFCEMVKMDALIRHDPNTYRLLEYERGMHPIGAQLVGSNVSIAADAAKIIEDFGFDVVDLNCGCPVDKVTKDCSGSGLLKEPQRIYEILSRMVKAVSIPVTVKIRIGWDESSIVAKEVVKIAEEAGAKLISVHGRTREQGYKGRANWSVIADCKRAAKDILVIGNGDIFSKEAALSIFEETNCDGVLVSRGTLGSPWIAEDIYRYLTNLSPIERGGFFIRKILEEHFEAIITTQTRRKAITDIRRVGCWYLKNAAGAKMLRNRLNKITSLEEIGDIMDSFAWEDLTLEPAFIEEFVDA